MKRIAAFGVSLLLAGGGAVIAATPAYADTTCPAHNFCLWTDGHFTGTKQIISGYASYQDVNSTLHDHASSWKNANASQRECVYDHVNGALVTLQVVNAGQQVGVVPAGTNDRADAIGFC
ncbi:peptidase inhibitor family I36 protein [Fodinicola feengrottensis]|uniref:Peptidase inhibitor family I36 n=1 Tax=Fodinicola feengrottensis TaxID=435914 RepID=A0ABP4RTC9_9ACTN|nr:peptidase inhibitor family I36 protein [Fodinicola feengrottensis]